MPSRVGLATLLEKGNLVPLAVYHPRTCTRSKSMVKRRTPISHAQQLQLFRDDCDKPYPLAIIDRRRGPHAWKAHEEHDPIRAENHRLLEQGLRRCRICKEVKALTWYCKQSGGVGGFQSICRVCDREPSRWRNLRKNYGISKEEYLAMYAAQSGMCAICGEAHGDIGVGRGETDVLVVDHDHSTGEVRGLLCFRCNSVLGHARDDIEKLQRAIIYLQGHTTQCDNVS